MHEFIMRASAAARRRKVLALDARNFKSACAVTLLDNFVNARDLNSLARLVNICHIASRCIKQRGSKFYAEVRRSVQSDAASGVTRRGCLRPTSSSGGLATMFSLAALVDGGRRVAGARAHARLEQGPQRPEASVF